MLRHIACFGAILLASACGPTASPRAELTPPTVPDAIKAPDTEKVVLKVFAKGTQNYACVADTTAASGYAWKLVQPDATLYAGEGDAAPRAGKHYSGPTWESIDGSKFIGDGAAAKKVDSPDATAIPWLLIPKKGAAGTGQFSVFSFAQRIDTTGGRAPTTGCDAAHLNATANVPYTAHYYFYQPK